jgi:hypothetical protein
MTVLNSNGLREIKEKNSEKSNGKVRNGETKNKKNQIKCSSVVNRLL